MPFHTVIRMMTLVLATSAASACASRSGQSALKAEDAFESCDLSASRAASADASYEALKCSYNALSLAGSLSTGGLAKQVYNLSVGLADTYSSVVDGQLLIGDFRDYFNSGGIEAVGVAPRSERARNDSVTLEDVTRVKNFLNSKFRSFESNLPGPARTAMYKCIAGQFGVFKDFLTFVELASDLRDAERFSPEQIKAIALAPVAFTAVLLDMMSSNLHCSTWLQGRRALAIEKAIKGIKAIQVPIASILTVANCGVAIGKGGYVLARNTMCFADDLKSYYAGREQLESLRDSTVNDLPIDTSDKTRGSRGCMQKFGMHLHKQSFYSYVYRSAVCADYCGDRDIGAGYLLDHMRDIYPRDDDYQWCSANVNTLQNRDAIDDCLVYCCDQDKSCADASRQRLSAE